MTLPLLILASGFLGTCLVLAVVFLPAPRAWMATLVTGLADGRRRSLTDGHAPGRQRCRSVFGTLRDRARRCCSWLQRRRSACGAVLALIVLPPAVVCLLRDHHVLDGYREAPADSGSLVARLLQGEQLVPPPAVPPDVFTSPELELTRPLLSGADREWERLDPEFRQRLLLVFRIMQEQHGYPMVLLEGYRSPERQAMLQAMGPHVTHAGPFQSYHQYGLAADIAFLRDGRVVISEQDPWALRGYQLYGEVAESLGLTWGGRWRLRDLGHVELRHPGPPPENKQ
jgi:peptidoglycan L-alanyl-D-glutamate endopeptidase CwlK